MNTHTKIRTSADLEREKKYRNNVPSKFQDPDPTYAIKIIPSSSIYGLFHNFLFCIYITKEDHYKLL